MQFNIIILIKIHHPTIMINIFNIVIKYYHNNLHPHHVQKHY